MSAIPTPTPPDPEAAMAVAVRDFVLETADCIENAEAALAFCMDGVAGPTGSPGAAGPTGSPGAAGPTGSPGAAAHGLDGVFRPIHTIKGAASILGFASIAAIANGIEDLLEDLRDSAVEVDADALGAMFAALQAVRALVDRVSVAGDDRGFDIEPVLTRLRSFRVADDNPDRVGDLLVASGATDRLSVELAAAQQVFGDTRKLGQILVDRGDASAASVADAVAGVATPARETSVRVEVGLLDELLELALDLTSSSADLERMLRSGASAEVTGHAVREVQSLVARVTEQVSRTRLQPIGVLWGRLPMVVRQAAHELGKEVHLHTDHPETMVDTATLQAIVGPVIHLVRNAVDHGIEAPKLRLATGKPERGELWLDARRVGRHLQIEVQDDGKGLDLEAIRRRAVERGLIGPALAQSVSDDLLREMVFLPGLSTSATVTEWSGRGVGLDVVREEVERLGGTVTIHSTPGRGTSFVLTIEDRPSRVRGLAGDE